jgi:hypothetical protein
MLTMPHTNNPHRASRGPWKKMLAGVAVATLLLPVPALALTFLGSWVFTSVITGGAPVPTTSFSDSANGGSLTIGMGSYSATPSASSEITATRNFTIPSGGQMVSVFRSWITTLQQANLQVKINIMKTNGNTSLDFNSADSAGLTQTTFTRTFTNSQRLTPGTYKVVIDILYKTNAATPHKWINSSPHRFDFTGV